MSKSHSNSNTISLHELQHEYEEQEEDYSEEEDSNFDDNSDEDPSFFTDLVNAQSKFSNLTLNNKSISSGRKCKERELNDEEMSTPILDNEEMKTFDQVQKIIDSGQVDKLKVEQCKVYLRKYGLRLTGKKDILIQRIGEHIEILNGGGEKKYPPSSFVLNCKGDACMGDVVMFEQTVYEGYSIVSRSAVAPPCGKRTIAGRIVKESYGAAKQQHTFTVEVLWSKGHKPLPPLHPLLIKGRNLYKLNTRRQKWEDEAERQKVLSEKHSRGSVARSNREARIQEKQVKMTLKGIRVFTKDRKNSCPHQDHMNARGKISLSESKTQGGEVQQQHVAVKKTQQQQNRQVLTSKVPAECKENPHPGFPRYQPFQHDKPNMPASHFHQEPRFQVNLKCKNHSSYEPHGAQNLHHRKSSSEGFVGINQPTRPDKILHHHAEYKENTLPPVSPPRSFQHRKSIPHPEGRNPMAYPQPNMPVPDEFQHPQSRYHCPIRLHGTTRGMSYRSHAINPQLITLMNPTAPWLRPSHTKQELCQYYPQGRCYFGSRCKFLHEPNRNYC